MIGRIYKITNLINGKIYIGQTIATINERWAGHKCDSKRKNTAIGNAINKYGEENFSIEVVEDDIDYELLDEKEIFYIKEYNSLYPVGYNISQGGKAYITDEWRKVLSERVKGENNPMYGACGELNPFYNKKHSEKTKQIIGDKARDRWNNLDEEEKEKVKNRLNYHRDKRIAEKGGCFKGYNHSEESINKIKSKLKGVKKTEEARINIKNGNSRKRKVHMMDKNSLEIIQTFDTMTIAAEWIKGKTDFNANASQISMVCSGRRKSAYGYKWQYA